LTLSEKFY